MEPLVFKPSKPFTLGVELEFQLLDKHSLNLSPRSPEILSEIPDELTNFIKPEFIQSMLEVCTPVCRDMAEVEAQLTKLCLKLEEMAARHGCLLYAASLHPYSLVEERHLSPGARYHTVMDDLQLAGRRLISQALHVHVGLPDGPTAIRVCDRIRTFLPVFLALTTSSPFFEGRDTGFSSYRTSIFKALPRSGIPGTLGSWDKFHDLVVVLNEATLLNGIKELWWDVRPHPVFGTIEIRICDLPSRFDEILAMTAFIQAVVATFAGGDDADFSRPHREIIMQNKWYAARYGLEGVFVSPKKGCHSTMVETTKYLLEKAGPAITEFGTSSYLQPIDRILAEGASAARQRRIFSDTGDLCTVIQKMRQDFWR